ncbi:MAG: hypothetical protein AAB694_01555, partial [Patescibacteria group bacterium]
MKARVQTILSPEQRWKGLIQGLFLGGILAAINLGFIRSYAFVVVAAYSLVLTLGWIMIATILVIIKRKRRKQVQLKEEFNTELGYAISLGIVTILAK